VHADIPEGNVMDSAVIATWVQAIGSAGSLMALSAWVGIAVINRRDEFEARFEREAQTVAAWLDESSEDIGGDGYMLCILNGGNSPIYRCEAVLPGLTARGEPSVVTTHLVPPHTTIHRPTPASIDKLTWEDIYSSGITPQVRFIDTSGRRWYRNGEGMLFAAGDRSRLRARRMAAHIDRAA
jgi:hypothetical protein